MHKDIHKLAKLSRERNNFTVKLKTYNCIVLTDFQHKKGGIPRDHSFLSHKTLT